MINKIVLYFHLQVYKRLLFLFLIAVGTGLSLSSSAGGNLSDFDSLVYKCLSSNSRDRCSQALLKLEELQGYAGVEKNYPCQTRLLGLGADLIMSQLNHDRHAAAAATMQEIKRLCGD